MMGIKLRLKVWWAKYWKPTALYDEAIDALGEVSQKMFKANAELKKELKAVEGHRDELEREIEKRCKAFNDSWCTKYDGVAECAPCFVQGNDEVNNDR